MWIYLECSMDSTSSAESGGLPSLSTNGCDQSLIAKLTPIVKESSCPELRLVNSRMPPYGMILKHWTGLDSHGDMSMSYLAASHVRISALHDWGKAWKESEADFFSRSYAWPKKSSPLSYSLKMFQLSQAEGDFKSLEKLPKWGMIVDGVLFPLRPLEHCTNVKDGFYWPTPCARDVRIGKRSLRSNLRKSQLCERIGIEKESDYGKKLCPLWIEQLMGYPTEWTELKPWAMQWYLLSAKKRSKY